MQISRENVRFGKIVKKKYVGVQSWKAAHLPTLEIRVKQKGNRVMKVEPYWEKNKNKKNSAKKLMGKKISE